MAQGSLPLHMQITELLIRDIAAGRLIDGQRLPPERDMAAGLGIAVGTLRKSLQALAARGLLTRVQGSGNYVRALGATASVYSLFRLERTAGGGLPTALVLSVDRLPKDPALPPFGPSRDGHRIRHLRSLSGTPSALEEIWLDTSRAETLTIDDLSESLYLTYRQRFGLRITRVEDRIGQGPVPVWAPPQFPCAPHTPLPMITRTGYDQDGLPAEASWTWFDPDTTRYVARFM
jgi:GntR family transcriptional regulator